MINAPIPQRIPPAQFTENPAVGGRWPKILPIIRRNVAVSTKNGIFDSGSAF